MDGGGSDGNALGTESAFIRPIPTSFNAAASLMLPH